MSLPLPRLALVLLAAVAAAVVGLFVSHQRVNGSGQPQRVLDRAFASDGGARSGRFMGALDVRVEGAPSEQLSNPVRMTLSGAFERGSKGRPENLENSYRGAVDLTVNAAGRAIQVGVVSTGTDAFIRFGSNYYSVPRQELASLAPGGSAASLSSLGIHPRSWVKDVKSEGTALVAGVQTDHLSAGVNTGKIVDDLAHLASKSGAPQVSKISGDDKEKLKDALHDARLDLYTGKADGILRKFSLHSKVEASGTSGTVDFNVELLDINKPQRITAPLTSRPFSQLQNDLQVGGLAALGGGGTTGGVQSGSVGGSSGGASGEGDSAAVPKESQAYLKCITKAGTPQALQSCAGLLP